MTLFKEWTKLIEGQTKETFDAFWKEYSEAETKIYSDILDHPEEPVDGNLKLARGIRGGKEKTLIETRGEGGLFLCAPSPGYHLVQGAFGSCFDVDSPIGLIDCARYDALIIPEGV